MDGAERVTQDLGDLRVRLTHAESELAAVNASRHTLTREIKELRSQLAQAAVASQVARLQVGVSHMAVSQYDPRDPYSIERYARFLVGRTLRDVLSREQAIKTVKGKGSFGEMLEKEYFGINPGNRPTPDFEDAGVELKTTPVRRNSRGSLVAKERLVLGMINYMNIVDETWERSSFRRKNQTLLLVFYRWEEGLSDLDYPVEIVRLWQFPEEDLEVIRDDWETIRRRVDKGEAHLMSEGETMYLAASTKGSKGTDRRIQPFSDEPARPRAFSLKAGYMNGVIRESLVHRTQAFAPLFELKTGMSLEDIVHERFRPYLGKTADRIAGELGVSVDRGAKNFFAILTKRVLGISDDRQIAEFQKADVNVRTIRLRPSGTPKEDISFPAFDYFDLVGQEWDESDLREQLTRRFFFVVYELDKAGFPRLLRTQFWTMPFRDLETHGRRCFEATKKRIAEGHADDLPKKSENSVCHVRPHGRNKEDTLPAPGGGRFVKKCFWLNAGYLARQLADSGDS